MDDGRRSRLFWPRRVVLAAGIVAVLAGIAGAQLAGQAQVVRFFDNLHWTAGAAGGAALAWLACSSAPSARRNSLRWIALGLTAYAIGQLVWMVQSWLDYAGFPAPADAFYLLLGPLVAAGLLTETFRLASPTERRTLLLDAGILTIAVTTLLLVLYLPLSGDMAPLPLTAIIAYPATLFAAASLGVIAAPTLHLKFSCGYWLLLLAVIVTGGSWVAWNAMALVGRTTDGIGLNGLFSLAALGMGAATLDWQVERSEYPLWERTSEGFLRMLPLLAVVMACGAVLWGDAYTGVSRSVGTAVVVGALLVILLALLRQSLLLRDRDELKAVTRSLEESEGQKRLILNTLPDLVWLKDPDGIFRMCNPAMAQFAGKPESEILGRTDFDLVEPELARAFRQEDGMAMLAQQPIRSEHWVRPASGDEVMIESVKTPLRDRSGKILGVLGIARDVTARERANQELALASFALNRVKEAAYMADEQGRFRYVNDEACRAIECTREELLRMTVMDIDCDVTTLAQWQAIWRENLLHKTIMVEGCHRTASGRRFPVEVNTSYFEFGGQAYVLGLIRDISERKQIEEQIRHLAYFDALTRLPNRRLLFDRVGHALVTGERSREFGALMILDLDNFKALNDTQGHDVGDRLLVDVARRLTSNVRQEDTVCRLGGDEFVVMLEGLGQDEAQAASQAEMIAEKIRAALNQPYTLNGNGNGLRFHSTTSIGLTLFCGQEASVDTLLKQADVALYQAKGAGRNQVRFFNPAMQAAIDSRMSLEAALRQALDRGEFRLYYQPQVARDGTLIGAEALLRWQPPGGPLIPPGEFIPLAEETGLILPIGKWVLDTACAQLKAWDDDPRARHLKMSVNVSARQFHEPDFVATVQASLEACGVDPQRLKLELTESVVLEKVDSVISRMRELNALGVSFCLDDFGTGYSSLSYLKRLPLDQVKIDQSFVRDVVEDENDAAIVQAIMAMSRSLGLQVIAEGVETQAQRDFLQGKCLAYQGFLFCQPVPIEEWERLLA